MKKNLTKPNTKCSECGHVVGKKLSMYSHLKKQHNITGPGSIDDNCSATSDPPTSPRMGGRKRKKKKDKTEPKKFNGFRGLDMYRGLPPNKGDVVIVVAVNLEINITRGTNRIIEK